RNPEFGLVVAVLVLEDLALAAYLPIVSVLLAGQSRGALVTSLCVAMGTVVAVLWGAIAWGERISRLLAHRSDEALLFTTLGLVLLVAGVAQRARVSAAIGAFLVGLALSGPIAQRAHALIGPLRDLFAAIFFLFFGLEINPAELP